MSDKRWGFFPFEAIDYKAAQAYLDQKAAAGWVLDALRLKRLARFVPAEGRYHAVDLDLRGMGDDGPDPDYLQLCADAGWELVKSTRGMLLFRSLPGQRPAPLQTDGEMEADRFWKKYMRRNVLGWLALLAVLAALCALSMCLPSSTPTLTSLLCTNALLLLLPALLSAAVYLVWSLGGTVGSYLRFRRSGRLPGRGRPGAWGMGVLACAVSVLVAAWWCLTMAEGFGLGRTVDVAWSSYSQEYTAAPELCQSYPVLTAADLGLSYSEDSRYLDGHRSPLADLLDYSEIAPGEGGETHILTTQRYRCAGEAFARLLFAARRWETARGAGFTWGELEWGEVSSDWGFDQVCAVPDGSYLLLRSGDTVVLVGATGFDLTRPEYREILCRRVLG